MYTVHLYTINKNGSRHGQKSFEQVATYSRHADRSVLMTLRSGKTLLLLPSPYESIEIEER